MEALISGFIAVALVVAFDVLALHFGVDSRDSIDTDDRRWIAP